MDSHHYFVRSPKLIGVSPAVSDLDFPLDEEAPGGAADVVVPASHGGAGAAQPSWGAWRRGHG